MPTPLETVALSLLTSVAGTFVTMWLVQPRLEARKARILEAHAARETFSASVLTIQGACQRLRAVRPDEEPAMGDVVRARLDRERERWLQQLDDATRWMIDNVETFATGWPTGTLRDLVHGYVGHARMVWLSERDEALRVKYLADLSAPVRDLFFAHAWRRRPIASVQRLQELFATIEAEGGDPASPPAITD